jgi:hypothetical protein
MQILYTLGVSRVNRKNEGQNIFLPSGNGAERLPRFCRIEMGKTGKNRAKLASNGPLDFGAILQNPVIF